MLKKIKNIAADLGLFVLLFASLFLCFAVIRTNLIWGNVSIEQILINMVEANNEAAQEIVEGYVIWTLIPALLLCTILTGLIKNNLYLCLIMLLSCGYSAYKLELAQFLINRNTYSEIYEKEYINPQNITFDFPDKKQNLIILHLESMEKNYADASLVGQNLLPNLSELAKQNISFDNFYQLHHQDYTLAGMLASYCAVPYKGFRQEGYTAFNNFLPDLVCLPQILQQNGYDTYFMKGATLDFSRTGIFFSSHGVEDLVGEDELYQKFGLNAQNSKGSSWGVKDSLLYAIAKQRLTEIAKQNKPFLFSLLSLDNHGPNLYIDEQCLSKFGPERDVILCADKMAYDFIDWITKQDFYKNTTVIIAGDHIKTGSNDLYPEYKNRQIYNVILNPAVKNIQPQQHQWTLLDLPPTALQAIGVKFDKGQFGLGRSLFEPYPTLIEQMGRELDNNLQKASKVYESFNVIKTTFTPLYTAYPQWGEYVNTPQTIKPYASFSDEAFNVLWLDTLSFTLPQPQKRNIGFDICFKMLFMAERSRNVDVWANGHKIAALSFNDDVHQPICRKITFDKSLLTPENKLLLEFKVNTPGNSMVSVGLGVESFKLENN